MVNKELNNKMGKLYKELFNLYNSEELFYVNDKEGIILRSLLINMCFNIGEDLSELVDLNCYEKSKEVDNVYKEYINNN
jgi:hypothetical protein